ncbi:MAG TPA: PilZ domain-containing protein [Bdellovibrionota bacterium]|nr:PilZ domain-containing protein [Bdellovibrionota bacterium]
MDLSPLRLKATIASPGAKSTELDWFGGEEDQIVLAPLFTLSEGNGGKVTFSLPQDFELEHLTRDLSVPVTVEQSEITGLVLRIEEFELSEQNRWTQLLKHLQERMGQMARVHPRVMAPEFNIGVWLTGKNSGKGKMFDISLGGMRVVSDLTVSAGEKIEFRFEILESLDWASFAQGLSWNGIVKSTQPRGFSIEFSENPPFRESMKKLVDALTKRRMRRLTYPRYNIHEFNIEGVVQPLLEKVRLKDISVSGSYVLTENILPIDSAVLLQIQKSHQFKSLNEGFDFHGRVARITPDGMIVAFMDMQKGDQARLSAWTAEVAAKFRKESAPREEGPAPKYTLSVSYGSDLLFIREYLYNLSSGGLFMPGVPPIDKGEVIRFVLDLSGTSLAEKIPNPPSFLGTVVRATDTGISVQFLDPDKIRAELETVMVDVLRNQQPPDRTSAAEQIADDMLQDLEPQSSHPVPFLSPTSAIIMTTISIIFIGLTILYYRRTPQPIVVDLDSLAAGRKSTAPSAPSETAAEAGAEHPEEVMLIDGPFMFPVRIADIDDVTYDPKTGVRVKLKQGADIPGEGLAPYLPRELAQKLGRLEAEALQRNASQADLNSIYLKHAPPQRWKRSPESPSIPSKR